MDLKTIIYVIVYMINKVEFDIFCWNSYIYNFQMLRHTTRTLLTQLDSLVASLSLATEWFALYAKPKFLTFLSFSQS